MTAERTPAGQFAPGNKGGPGNPFARQVAALRSRLIHSATPEDIDKVAALLKEMALSGDLAAIKLWLSYVVGKPSEPPDPDTIDSHDLRVRRENTATSEDMRVLSESVPASMMCNIAAVIQPPLRKHLAEEFLEGVRDFLESDAPPTRDPMHAWREAGLSGEASAIFEECPAWLPTGAARSVMPPHFQAAAEGIARTFLGRANGGQAATPPVNQRVGDGPPSS